MQAPDVHISVIESQNGMKAVTALCPVCRKSVVMAPVLRDVFRVPYHQDKYGVCSGTSREANLTNVRQLLRN